MNVNRYKASAVKRCRHFNLAIYTLLAENCHLRSICATPSNGNQEGSLAPSLPAAPGAKDQAVSQQRNYEPTALMRANQDSRPLRELVPPPAPFYLTLSHM